MTSHPEALRRQAMEQVRALLVALESSQSLDSVVNVYLDTKRTLARTFRELAEQKYSNSSAFGGVRDQVEAAMLELFPLVPGKYRVARGFGRVHELLFTFLSSHVGAVVSAEELRVLTGDAVHTERRTRELRDLGLNLEVTTMAGKPAYLLHSAMPDAAHGAANLVRLNISRDAALNASDRQSLLSLLH